MIKLEYCPFCGAEYFIFGFGKTKNFMPDELVTCPDCGRKYRLGKFETYRITKEDRR